ncbi:hypothetical protein MKEN_00064200 [Mycena kentingensis (nom. inval.)]|nr:hypothetical protein MKEN_00064200 [Mycena kentingensis (nom. inval.)]
MKDSEFPETDMLYLHPYYQPGAQLTLNLRSCIDDRKIEQNVCVTVAKALTPFTMSQVLLVDVYPPVPNILPAATASFILKVYDPRFLQHRKGTKNSAPHPWTLAAEATAARRRELAVTQDLRTFWPDDHDAAGWEEYYHHNLQEMFVNELSAYEHLLPLQGRSIPICYAHGNLVPDSQRAIVPRVLLLSHISGPNIRAVHPSRIPTHVGRGLLDTIRAIGALGVVHDDIRADNILLAPADHPARAWVIDFGNARVRQDESDEEWDWVLEENDEAALTEMILDKMGVHHWDEEE